MVPRRPSSQGKSLLWEPMCSVTNTAALSVAGKPTTIVRIASTPPAEAPITIICICSRSGDLIMISIHAGNARSVLKTPAVAASRQGPSAQADPPPEPRSLSGAAQPSAFFSKSTTCATLFEMRKLCPENDRFLNTRRQGPKCCRICKCARFLAAFSSRYLSSSRSRSLHQNGDDWLADRPVSAIIGTFLPFVSDVSNGGFCQKPTSGVRPRCTA